MAVMLVGNPGYSPLFLLVRSVSRDGCTRFGSPGIFGVPRCYPSCSAASTQETSICHAAGCRANIRPFWDRWGRQLPPRSVVAGGFLYELHPRGESEFGVDVGEVGLHGAPRDE